MHFYLLIIVIPTVFKIVQYLQVSHISLNRGLFLCYLQARSTVDGTIEVAVCNTSPSILPYVKIRDNPHVNSDEWAWIHRLSTTTSGSNLNVHKLCTANLDDV